MSAQQSALLRRGVFLFIVTCALLPLFVPSVSAASYCIPGSGQVVDIRLKPSGTWGSQPTFFSSRAEAPSSTAATQLRITQAIVPLRSSLPTITVQAMARAISSIDNSAITIPANTIVAPRMNSSFGVSLLVLPLNSVTGLPVSNTTDAPLITGFDVNGEATITLSSLESSFPTVSRLYNQSTLFAIQLQFVVGVTPVPGSSTVLSMPLNVTAAAPLPTPWALSFPPRFWSGDSRNLGRPFTDAANWSLGLTSFVADDRTTAVPREGFTACVTMNVPLRAFAVDVAFVLSAGGSIDPENYNVAIKYLNPTSLVLMDDGLINNTAPINSRGRAIFTGFQATAALGTVQMLVVLIRVGVDPFNTLTPTARFALALLRNVPALTFTLQVNRVRRQASRLTFLRQRGLMAAFLAKTESIPLRGGFALVPGYVLPPVTIGVLDSSGEMDLSASGTLVASFSGPTITGNQTAPIVAGVATFDNLIVTGLQTLLGSSIVITFSALPQISTAAAPIAVSTLPLVVAAVPTRLNLSPQGIMRLVFSPANTQFPDEGIPATIALGAVLPPIQVHAATAVDASLTTDVNGLVVTVKCINLVDSVNDCGINGTTSVPFADPNTGFSNTGTALFTDLRFSSMPSGGYARLIFTVTQATVTTTTPVFAATLGYELATGLVRILPPAVSTSSTSVSFDVDAGSQNAFLAELGSDLVLVDSVGRIPVVSFLLYDGLRNLNQIDSETGVVASVSGGGCRLSGSTAYAWRGRVSFTNLRMLDCDTSAGLVRLVFTFFGSGLVNRLAGRAWLSCPVQYSPDPTGDELGWLRFIGAQPLFRHREYAYVSFGSQLPTLTIGVFPSWSGDAPTTVTATSAGITSIRLSGQGSVNAANNRPTDVAPVNGTVTYNIGVQSLGTSIASIYIWFCNSALVVPCLRRWLIFEYGWLPLVTFTRGPGPSIPLNSPLVVSAPSTMSALVAAGTLDQSQGAFRSYNPTPSTATDPYLKVLTSEAMDGGPSLSNVTLTARFNSSGSLSLPTIRIVNPSWALTDGLLFIAVQSSFVPAAPSASAGLPPFEPINVAMYPPVQLQMPPAPANRSNELTFYVAQPRSLFQPLAWTQSVASMFQISANQIVIERIVDSQLTPQRNALTTTVEARIVAPATVDPRKVNIDLVSAQIEAFQPSCKLPTYVNLYTVTERGAPLSPPTCDGSRLTEWIEAAAHCEEFLGADLRCNCSSYLFEVMGDVCSSNAQVLPLCVSLSQCSKFPSITNVCNQVVPNVYLRIALVVGGTALSLVLLTLLLRASDRFGRGTTSVKVKAETLRGEREHHNDLFL